MTTQSLPTQPLSELEQGFVEEYCTGSSTGKRFNKTAAAIHAGYSEHSAHNLGLQCYSRPHVKAAIEARLREMSMGKAEIQQRLERIATAQIGDCIVMRKDPVSGLSFPVFDWDAVERCKDLIKEFYYDANGAPRIKFHDSHDALKDLAKANRMFGTSDSLEISGQVQVSMQVEFVAPGAAAGQHGGQQAELPLGEADWAWADESDQSDADAQADVSDESDSD